MAFRFFFSHLKPYYFILSIILSLLVPIAYVNGHAICDIIIFSSGLLASVSS